MHENREISCTSWSKDQDRSAKAIIRTADVNVQEKSDCAVVPVNRPNKEGKPSAEAGEGREHWDEELLALELQEIQDANFDLRTNISPLPEPQLAMSVRDALHQAAEAEGCDFPGLGPHSFRRANITWRQQVGGSAIEASKIAGHSDLEMTSEYTFVTPDRQDELTRRIQEKLAEAANNGNGKVGTPPDLPDGSPSLAQMKPVTTVPQ